MGAAPASRCAGTGSRSPGRARAVSTRRCNGDDSTTANSMQLERNAQPAIYESPTGPPSAIIDTPKRIGMEFRGSERFILRRRLGDGGFGVVYEAFDREQNAVVALKVLSQASALNLYRFKQEFRALADLVHVN